MSEQTELPRARAQDPGANRLNSEELGSKTRGANSEQLGPKTERANRLNPEELGSKTREPIG